MSISNDFRHHYTDGVHNLSIAVLDPYPPPIDGVSVHIQRTVEKLGRQKNCVKLFETTTEYRYRFLPYYLRKYNSLLSSIDKFVFIGLSTHKSYKDAGLTMPLCVTVEGAFLPPNQQDEHRIVGAYPISLNEFIKNHRPLILANAFQLSHVSGHDLYGVDLCIKLLENLVKEYPQIGFVLALAQVGDRQYFERLCSLARTMQIEQHLYILDGQKELRPLFKKVDLFVRPTFSDAGASISVQEALFFGVPVVASDVCERPAQVVLFKNRDIIDFTEKVMHALRGSESNPIKGGQ